jgi:hypothetical protein
MQRWSNANREQRLKLQAVGGTMTAEATFQGLIIGNSVGSYYGRRIVPLPFRRDM